MDRRNFIKVSSLAAISIPAKKVGALNAELLAAGKEIHSGNSKSVSVAAFMKPFEKWVQEDWITLLKEAGFKGVDITLRKGGLIDPQHASKELPALISKLQQHGMQITGVTTGIIDPAEKETENILRLLQDHGIGFYRCGSSKYDKKLTVSQNLDVFKRKFGKLAQLNEKYRLHGAIQNHYGTNLGAAVWDAYEVVKDSNPDYMGIQYDIRHAVAEGMGSWSVTFERVAQHVRSICIKDFTWIEKDGKFRPLSVPLGEGIVDFDKYSTLLNPATNERMVSIHYEYPLLHAGQESLSGKDKINAALPLVKADLDNYYTMIMKNR